MFQLSTIDCTLVIRNTDITLFGEPTANEVDVILIEIF